VDERLELLDVETDTGLIRRPISTRTWPVFIAPESASFGGLHGVE
jgi:hypothetical protein